MRRLSVILCWLTGTAFAATGFAKLMDLGEFEAQLAGWTLLSEPSLRARLVIGLPAIEILLFVGFACFPEKRAVYACCMLVVLITFSAAYSIEALGSGPPDCACFGIFSRHVAFQHEAGWVIARNAFLALPPAMLLAANRGRGGLSPRASVSRGARGFSVLEMLIVIVVVVALLAILFPVLRHVRRSGRDAGTLNNLRQHAGVFLLYSADHREQFPYFTKPLPGPATPLEDPSGRIWNVGYFHAHFMWPVALSHGYYNGTTTRGSIRSPFRSPEPTWDYQYPCVFIADPAYWSTFTRKHPPVQFRAVKLSEVAHPGSKVLISDDALWKSTERTSPQGAGGCVDGHAEIIAVGRMAPFYRPGDTSFEYGRHISSNPLMHTLGGVHAADFGPR
ncbi:MAG: hypothetical protein SFY69_03280 [Planctomycetota bacterium]|nr:hypothetical protein [Planctomycetota bacterium]